MSFALHCAQYTSKRAFQVNRRYSKEHCIANQVKVSRAEHDGCLRNQAGGNAISGSSAFEVVQRFIEGVFIDRLHFKIPMDQSVADLVFVMLRQHDVLSQQSPRKLLIILRRKYASIDEDT